MSLKNETADALYAAIGDAVKDTGVTKNIAALRELAEAFSLVASTGSGTRDSAGRNAVTG